MDIIKSAAIALESIAAQGIPVQAGWYDDSIQHIHITLWNLSDYEGAHSDDEAEVDVGMLQINIWAHEDQQQLKKRVKKLMKQAGFLYVDGEDNQEPDTKIHVNAMRFLLMEEAEEIKEETNNA